MLAQLPAAGGSQPLLDASSNASHTVAVAAKSLRTSRTPAGDGSVKSTIRQRRPFRSPAHEAVVALLLTSNTVRWRYQDLLAEHDLSLPAYNVLRILRGAGSAALPTLEIGQRMIERTPGVTRLLDGLVARGLVARARTGADRRQVLCLATPAGLALLRTLDPVIDALDETAMAGLTRAEATRLVRLLDKVRLQNSTPPAP
jgi:DNA-binding MarR family transcriptional regulator